MWHTNSNSAEIVSSISQLSVFRAAGQQCAVTYHPPTPPVADLEGTGNAKLWQVIQNVYLLYNLKKFC